MRQITGPEDNPNPPLRDEHGNYTPEIKLCIEAAQQLERDGVRAIAMCCGFFSLIQPLVADSVDMPVIT